MNKWVLAVVLLLVFLCCCLAIVCVAGGILAYNVSSGQGAEDLIPTQVRPFVTVEINPSPEIETPTPEILRDPVDEGAYETLQTLMNAIVPNNDPRDLAQRLEGKENIPLTVPAPSAPLKVGARKAFWVSNVDTNENFQVNATLRYITDHVYFWIEEGLEYDQGELRDLAETFENKIYPTNREFFGSEWTPGVDNDPHLYILYARGLGSNLAGYFSSADELHPLAHEYSNAHEMFLLNADNLTLGEEYTYGVLAHEFQHMIHWYRDRNETSWLNEGFSELAAFLNGYDVGGFDYVYMADPDLQLTDWPNDPDATTPHYGASFLFVTYFLDRFGEKATQALVANTDNGMDSVDAVLASLGSVNKATGDPYEADDVFADWVVANYLRDKTVGNGQYVYHNYPYSPQAGDTEVISDCSSNWLDRTVNQYGVDYIRLQCNRPLTLSFEGSTQVGVLPMDPYSGQYAFWSNKGDESDMTLTRTFDFTDASGPLTLSYWTWYDIEEDYDYVYLVASEDGQKWQILTTPSGTAEDPSGNSYGWGYNGVTPGWVQEEVDLTQFAGKKVELRFEYVTDAAVNGEGFLLDDVAIPEIGYQEDFEDGDGGWVADGFVRIQNILPQTFRLSLITLGESIDVQSFTIDSGEKIRLPLNFGNDFDEAVLVVSGTTRFTRQLANYRFEFQP